MPARTKPALLEREAELDELQTALEDARRGIGRLVVVEGAAGIGKTRLLESARETAGRTGMRAPAPAPRSAHGLRRSGSWSAKNRG
jgi:AAA ATPase domain